MTPKMAKNRKKLEHDTLQFYAVSFQIAGVRVTSYNLSKRLFATQGKFKLKDHVMPCFVVSQYDVIFSIRGVKKNFGGRGKGGCATSYFQFPALSSLQFCTIFLSSVSKDKPSIYVHSIINCFQ